MNRIRPILLLIISALCAVGAVAQPLRINRQRLCIEGATFVKKAAVSSQNYLFIDDFTIKPGETKTVPVYLTSTMPIWMFQVDLALPEGLTASGVDFSATFSATSQASQFQLYEGIVDGNYRILAANMSKTQSIPSGSRTHLLDLTITASETLPPQTYTVLIGGFDFVEAATGNDIAYEGGTSSFTVTVNSVLASSVDVFPTSASLYVGETVTLMAIVQPDDVTNPTVNWTSGNTAVATVDQSGKVTAVGAGQTLITATTTDGTYLSSTCSVTVSPVLATGITVTPPSVTVNVGETAQLTATVTPASTTNKAVTWSSSNESVAIVDQNGLMAAVAPGTATITATTADGTGLSAVCQVEVIQPATGIRLNKTATTLNAGTTETLTATVLPSTATDKTVAWTTSDAAVATVDQSGTVTAVAAGTATITATTTDGTNLSASCVVTVTQPVTAISVTPSAATLTVGGTVQLTATAAPGNATNPAVTWKSDMPTVATVSSTGKVTARGVGTATITATTKDGTELSASCQVEVIQPATGISLNKTATTLPVGSTETLVATVLPDNATHHEVAWSTSDAAVATVDQNGTVTAVGVGTATITATTTDGTDLSASCVVTVTEVLAAALDLDKTYVGLALGETVKLNAIVQPDDVTNPTVMWTSSDQSVVTVDQNGVVSARAVGMTTVIAQTTDGSGLVAACTVRVCPRGDINLDGVVDVSDVNISINIVLDKDNAANYNRRAYITGDNVVDIGDVNALINILLGH